MKLLVDGTFFFFILLMFFHPLNSHITITYPQARLHRFDFINNIQYIPPCGVDYKEDQSAITTFLSGEKVNVTWRINNPILGVMKMELLETDGTMKKELGEKICVNDSTCNWHEFELEKDDECEHCIMRLSREASKWTNGGDADGIKFWSCADVSIVDASAKDDDGCFDKLCLNGGTCTSGECTCDKGFTGDRCEVITDCVSDEDCTSHGKCLSTSHSEIHKKVCYCEPSWMGRYCDKESEFDSAVIGEEELESFRKKELYDDPEFTLFWKFQNDNEIEIMMRVKTTTWAAIGWRPSNILQSCKSFPDGITVKDKPDEKGEGDEDESKEEEKEEGEEEEENEEEEASRRRRDISSSGRQRREEEEEEEDEEEEEEKAEESGENKVTRKYCLEKTETENKEEASKAEGETREDGEEPAGVLYAEGLHPMDCSDIIMFSARDNLHRIVDSYTRDRSTPQPDWWYGGSDDVTAAIANHVDGFLYARFKRKLVSSDKADHSWEDQSYEVIWARGQTSASFHHNPVSGLETCQLSDYDYYQANELKYHGAKPSQRGRLTFNFYDDPEVPHDKMVTESFRYPEDCVDDDCEYKADWKCRKSTNKVEFKLAAKVKEESWIAIGFSEDKNMENSDAAVGWIEASSGKLVLTDRWLTEKLPEGIAIDNGESSFSDEEGKYEDGVLTISFSRKLDTEDKNDLALIDCVYFLYAWGGQIVDGDLSKHNNSIVSDKKICVGSSAGYHWNASLALWLTFLRCAWILMGH